MSRVELMQTDHFYQINMTAGNTGNTFDYEALDDWNAALDQLPKEGNTSLVITADHAKFFSAGIDLKFIEREGLESIKTQFIPQFDQLLERVAVLNMPTLAAINGHAYGGGSLMATACDFRVMRSDNGNFCFPEIDVKLVFSPFMQKLLNTKLPQPIKDRLCLTGAAITGAELAETGLAQAATVEAFADQVNAFAALLAKKDRATYDGIKRGLMRGLYTA